MQTRKLLQGQRFLICFINGAQRHRWFSSSNSRQYFITLFVNFIGKGQSVWDTYTHEHPDRIADGSNGDDVAKSYYKYKEDVKAIKEMGVN
jgi:beta-glucosidase/6-phospho-beta-glucosidase/beta-galactosidase